jgi:hypothetical protein
MTPCLLSLKTVAFAPYAPTSGQLDLLSPKLGDCGGQNNVIRVKPNSSLRFSQLRGLVKLKRRKLRLSR